MLKFSTKLFLLFFFLLSLLTTNNYFSQNSRIAITEKIFNENKYSFPASNYSFLTPLETNGDFSTTVYTFSDITVLPYFDNTIVSIYDVNGVLKDTKTLALDKYQTFNYGSSVFRIVDNKTYTVLVEDATTTGIDGYFAIDEAGRALSTRLNTWMITI